MDALLYDDIDILERVDEYTLYCHYLGYEPELRASYQSPIREDDVHGSFGIFIPTNQRGIRRREYMWSDKGAGGKLFGDVFDLVRYLYGYRNRQQAVNHVKREFFLGGITDAERKLMAREVPPLPPPMKIRIKSRAFTVNELLWWREINISNAQLNRYHTKAVQYYWMIEGQHAPSFPRSTMYAYNIYDRYQLYWPNESRDKKFRNDLLENYIMGAPQLRGNSDTIIINKSLKDVMCVDSLGFESVAVRSESVMLPEWFLRELERQYRHIFLLFDNDGKHNAERYPESYHRILVPESSGQKDTTDYCRRYGPNETLHMLNSIMYGHRRVA